MCIRDRPKVTTPKEFFGFNIGDDWKLANYDQFQEYWKKIDAESDRMRVEEIGKTAEGRPQLMAIVTSPENFKKLDRFKEIAKKLALAESLTDDEAHALAREGKAVVWIDGGLHATEVLGAHQLIETSYQLVSRNDPETLRILNDDIMLLVHVNPDGMQLVSNWYMKDADTLKRNMNIPRLYQKYIGHDDNRDFYILNQPETINDARIAYHEWFPQIVYNHHQTGPAGTVMFAPPFRDAFTFNFDPLIPVQLDLVAAAMHTRFEAEGKPGVTMRTGSSYSTWWNGGLRTLAYFHNMIGLLTETIGNPTPMEIPLVVRNQLPRADLPYPIAPQQWHFRQSIDYSITANWAVMDVASRYRETLLYNIYRMGKNSIERGSRDSWTTTPSELDSLDAAVARERIELAGCRRPGVAAAALDGVLPHAIDVVQQRLTIARCHVHHRPVRGDRVIDRLAEVPLLRRDRIRQVGARKLIAHDEWNLHGRRIADRLRQQPDHVVGVRERTETAVPPGRVARARAHGHARLPFRLEARVHGRGNEIQLHRNERVEVEVERIAERRREHHRARGPGLVMIVDDLREPLVVRDPRVVDRLGLIQDV